MPPLPLAPNVMKLKISGTTQTRPVVHIQHIQYSGGVPTAADCAAIATAVRASWNTRFASVLNSQTSYTLFEVTDLASNVGATGSNSTVVNGSGGTPTNLNAAQCAVLSWKTALHFRGGHSRTYLPFRNGVDMLNAFTIGSAYQTALAAAGNGYIGDVNAISTSSLVLAFAMLSYHSKNAPRPTPLSFAITSCVVHQRIDTQRRRLGKEF